MTLLAPHATVLDVHMVITHCVPGTDGSQECDEGSSAEEDS